MRTRGSRLDFLIVIKYLIADHTPSGKIIKADLRKIAAEEWAKRKMTEIGKGKL